MYKPILCIMLTLLAIACTTKQQTAMHEKTNRVQVAINEKESKISAALKQHQLNKDSIHILFVAYKDMDELQLYAKNSNQEVFKKIVSYPICQRSGNLGPKKAEGDKQVPEGFYHIDRFNTQSSYYLSLGINYPNELDKSLGYTGSDIFIHGACETVGCLPMTDDLIKEIYLYALKAKNAGQENIPVYIFPFEMTTENMQKLKPNTDNSTFQFWTNLQEGYSNFKANGKALTYKIVNGKYQFI